MESMKKNVGSKRILKITSGKVGIRRAQRVKKEKRRTGKDSKLSGERKYSHKYKNLKKVKGERSGDK